MPMPLVEVPWRRHHLGVRWPPVREQFTASPQQQVTFPEKPRALSRREGWREGLDPFGIPERLLCGPS